MSSDKVSESVLTLPDKRLIVSPSLRLYVNASSKETYPFISVIVGSDIVMPVGLKPRKKFETVFNIPRIIFTGVTLGSSDSVDESEDVSVSELSWLSSGGFPL